MNTQHKELRYGSLGPQAYILSIAAALSIFLLLQQFWDIRLAATAVAVLAAAWICYLEWLNPYRASWQPDRSQVKTDLVYMALVQNLLPLSLGYLAAVYIGAGAKAFSLQPLWPQQWPLWTQVTLMLLGSEFFRYWLHRVSHHWAPLWALHAVHHSSRKLNWINVGRFHPVEKSLQFLLDTLPFLVLGVSQEVISAYFVLYATNGFFQHANINLRLGWLNWIVSGPELHRWHHSRRPGESDSNFGNNLIVWDWVFATRYLPANRVVDELGLINRNYPGAFTGQMIAPFKPGLDKKEDTQ